MKLRFEPDLDYQQGAIAAICDLFSGQEACRTEFTVSHGLADQLPGFQAGELGGCGSPRPRRARSTGSGSGSTATSADPLALDFPTVEDGAPRAAPELPIVYSTPSPASPSDGDWISFAADPSTPRRYQRRPHDPGFLRGLGPSLPPAGGRLHSCWPDVASTSLTASARMSAGDGIMIPAPRYEDSRWTFRYHVRAGGRPKGARPGQGLPASRPSGWIRMSAGGIR